MTMTVGSLFSGYGGLDLGVSLLTDTHTSWVCDLDAGPRKVLAHRYPDAPNLGDVTTIDWTQVEPVDVITGGSPCQDLSVAGRRAGMRPGTRSGLWEAMTHAIATIRPALVVWENVRGALSAPAFSLMEPVPGRVGGGADGPSLRALGRVLGDLANLGYDAQWTTLPASAAGAPHRRERVFVLAHRQGDASSAGALVCEVTPSPAGDADILRTPSASLGTSGGGMDPAARLAGGHTVSLADQVSVLLPTPSVADALGGHAQRGGSRSDEVLLPGAVRPEVYGTYASAVARWESVLGVAAPSPTEPGRSGGPRLSARFVEWMMGLPAGWVTDVPGVTRPEGLKLLGNGVVPQQAALALSTLAGWAVSA